MINVALSTGAFEGIDRGPQIPAFAENLENLEASSKTHGSNDSECCRKCFTIRSGGRFWDILGSEKVMRKFVLLINDIFTFLKELGLKFDSKFLVDRNYSV